MGNKMSKEEVVKKWAKLWHTEILRPQQIKEFLQDIGDNELNSHEVADDMVKQWHSIREQEKQGQESKGE